MKIEKTISIRISSSCKELGSSPRDRQNQEGVGVRGTIQSFIRNGYYIVGLLHIFAANHEKLMDIASNTVGRLI